MPPLRQATTAALCLLLSLAGAASAFDSVDDDRTWAVTGVAVIDVQTGAVREGQTIVVQRGVIEWVGPDGAAPLPDGTLRVEERGRYVIPGLWDMHVHLRGGPSLERANQRWLTQYLGFGVTSVRDAGGDLPEAVLRWKEAVGRGEIFGPRIFTSLRKIDGPAGAWEGSIPVSSSADVARALDELQAAGADFVKVYDGSIAPERYLETLADAERRGLLTAGHVPLSVPFEDAIGAGLDSVEHAFHLLKAANPDDRAASRRFARRGIPEDFEPYFMAVSALGAQADEQHARRVFREMAARGAALTPTLYIRHVWNGVTRHDDGRDDPRYEATPPAIRDTFAIGLEIFADRTAEERASDLRLEELSMRLTRLAAEEGVTILAGSDTGAENPLLYPGDSLHHELEALVGAGLAPLRALQAATIEPARWFGKTRELGTLEKGKAADFVILDANPLENIENTRAIAAVVQQGVFFDRDELADLRRLSSADAD
jgi:imidazolonepropionase-like amidohydrolase